MKKIVKKNGAQTKYYKDAWKAIEDAVIANYGILIPSGEITVTITLPWTNEGALGLLKRNGKITSWEQDKEYEEGNFRRYRIFMDGEKMWTPRIDVEGHVKDFAYKLSRYIEKARRLQIGEPTVFLSFR